MPIGSAPAAIRRSTTRAERAGWYAKAGQAAVVSSPATSMLSLIANGRPYSGKSLGPASKRLAWARIAASSNRLIQILSSACRASRRTTASATATGVSVPAA